ncbi:MAG: hypothetical protein SGPRY_000421 [Prymnesium sp.]
MRRKDTAGRVRVYLNLIAGADLLAADKGGTSDPYVCLSLMGQKRTSKVQKATLDPTWDEDFAWKARAPLRPPPIPTSPPLPGTTAEVFRRYSLITIASAEFDC